MTRVIFLLAALLASHAALAAAPVDSVNALHAALLDNMRSGGKAGAAGTCAKRAQHLQPVVALRFDVAFVAQRILRKRWAELNPEQRKQFIAALEELVVTSYASQFSSYNGESFTSLASEDLAAGNKVVHTAFKHGAETTRFDYVLRADAKGDWRIANVLADGVSDLAIRSAQYDKLYQDRGYAGLLAFIQSQTAKNKTGC